MSVFTALRPAVKRYKQQKGVGGLCPWLLLIRDGSLVVNTDGSLMAAFAYQGPDIESCPDDSWRFGLESIMATLRVFDARVTIWTMRDKRKHQYARPSDIKNDVARWFDDALGAHVDGGGLFRSNDTVFVGFAPLATGDTLMEEMQMRMSTGENTALQAFSGAMKAMLSRQHRVERLGAIMDQSIEQFETQLASFISGMASTCGVRRLKGDEFRGALSRRVNPASYSRARVIGEAARNPWLHTYIPTDSLYRMEGGVWKFSGMDGDKYACMLTLRGSTPDFIANHIIEEISSIPVEMTISQMFRFMSIETSKKRALDARSHYLSMVKSPLVVAIEKTIGTVIDKIDPAMQALADDALEAVAEIDMAALPNGHHSMTIMVFGNSPENTKANARTVATVLADRGYGAIFEDMYSTGAFCTTLPGARDLAVRAVERSGANAIDLFPFRTRHWGQDVNPALTARTRREQRALGLFGTLNDVPYWLNLHVRDVGHFAFIGGTGKGKTTLANLLIMLWHRHHPCRVFTLDMNGSTYIPIKAAGGNYLDLRPDSAHRPKMNPMKWLKRPGTRSKLRQFLRNAMTSFGAGPISAEETKVLDAALDMLARSPGPVRLADLYIALKGTQPSLSIRLANWVSFPDNRGRYGDLFDHYEDTLDLGGSCGLNAGDLIKDPDLAPAMLVYIFESIDDSMDGSTPTLIYLEEAWNNLRMREFQQYWDTCLRTMRAKLGVVGLSTHELDDVRATDISASMRENMLTYFFLPSHKALQDADVYKIFGLRDEQIQQIARATPNSDYLLVQEGFSRMLRVALPKHLRAITNGDLSWVESFKKHELSGQEDWLEKYITEFTSA